MRFTFETEITAKAQRAQRFTKITERKTEDASAHLDIPEIRYQLFFFAFFASLR
jgi:hypothetical protein